ncbi:MAG: DEAD/DEAH box helicase [Acidobacteriota bacterium]|nr:DEAD/DEAH box helicase [Acidobacteriota bacterium]
MARSKKKDPFLYDMDSLEAIVSKRIIRRGINYFNENRVIQLAHTPTGISACVQGSAPGNTYLVDITVDSDEELIVDCTCPFDWEPICKHAVATLLAYEEKVKKESVEVKSAAAAAAAERARRGRTEVQVKHISGHPTFGSWLATSVSSHYSRTYNVEIRSLEAPRNSCSCPDYMVNFLGTCKHIEAVLHRLTEDPPQYGFGAPIAYLYLNWNVKDAPAVTLEGGEKVSSMSHGRLKPFFDVTGRLMGSLPEAFYHLRKRCQDLDDFLIGQEVEAYVNYVAEQKSRELKGLHIKQEIESSGGVLPGINARLYPYQVTGAAFLAARGRAMLADDMGLGKTLQALAAASWLQHHDHVKGVLVICPTSLKAQWAREITRFTGKEVTVVQGPARSRTVQYRGAVPYTVVNFELAIRDLDLINKNTHYDLLIVDEAQRLKNWRTKSATAVKLIQSRYCFVLTGTPLENRLEDLYSLCQLIDSRILGPLWRFVEVYYITDTSGRVQGYRNLTELRRRIAPIMLRRDRSLVRDQLPDRIVHHLDLPLTTRQLELQQEALSAAASIAQIRRKRPLTPTEEKRMMAALQTARMACNAAGLVDKQSEGSPKLDELTRLLEEICVAEGQKVVVFSQWERMTRMVEERALQLKLGVVRLHGGVPSQNRGALMDSFRDDPATQVFISTDAGGVGLNLQNAAFLINLDVPWNPAVLNQRIARVHRLGQSRQVQVIMMISADSYEEHVLKLIETKHDLFKNVVSGETGEDVVGISKRVIESLAEDVLLNQDPKKGTQARSGIVIEPEIIHMGKDGIKPAEGLSEEENLKNDRTLRKMVAKLQELLGSSLERVATARGSLIAVVDHVNDQLETAVADMEQIVPVALLDQRSWLALESLGEASPLTGAVTLHEQTEPVDRSAPLRQLAERKIEAAEALLERDCNVECIGLAVDAMIASICARAGLEEMPPSNQVPVWIYTTALPKGFINADEAVEITKAVALTAAAELPSDLAGAVYRRALHFRGGSGESETNQLASI